MIYNKEGFQEEAIKNVLTELIKHHDALRMAYKRMINKSLKSLEAQKLHYMIYK